MLLVDRARDAALFRQLSGRTLCELTEQGYDVDRVARAVFVRFTSESCIVKLSPAALVAQLRMRSLGDDTAVVALLDAPLVSSR